MLREGRHLDEVLGGQRLCNGHCEGHLMVCLVLVHHVLLLQQEELVMQHILTIAVLHDDPEWLHKAMQRILCRKLGQHMLQNRPHKSRNPTLYMDARH